MLIHREWLACALAVTLLGVMGGGIRSKSHEYDHLGSSAFLSMGDSSSREDVAGGNVMLTFCDSKVIGRLPYSACLLGSRLYGASGVAIPRWTGARLGNDILQAMHAIIYAEALGLPEVSFPSEGGNLQQLFDMPLKLSIVHNPELQRRVRCSFHTSSDFLDGSACEGVTRRDYRHALLTYFKPRLNAAARKACSAEAGGFDGLTIHLRSGDLRNSDHKQGQFLPCAFHELAIAAGSYKKVRVVTEPDLAHPCLPLLRRRHGEKLHVQSKSLQEDACALMSAKHLEYGDSTFSQVLELMNENAKNVSMPSVLAGGKHEWYAAGTPDDPMGLMAPCAGDDEHGRTYSLYAVIGHEKRRRGNDRAAYMRSTPPADLRSTFACG